MFGAKTILIVEKNAYEALDLTLAIQDLDGRVAGPVATIDDVRLILDDEAVAGAVVNCELENEQSHGVVLLLIERNVPWVGQTSGSPHESPATAGKRCTLLRKPIDVRLVLSNLFMQMDGESAGR